MAEPKEIPLMEKIVSLCKRRGFIFQSSEIYGGINGFWDYGPLGAELKRNVKELWWNTMTRQRDDVVGLEATIIMSPQIWKASGHVDTFSDPMCDCKFCKKRFRADQVLELLSESRLAQSLHSVHETHRPTLAAYSADIHVLEQNAGSAEAKLFPPSDMPNVTPSDDWMPGLKEIWEKHKSNLDSLAKALRRWAANEAKKFAPNLALVLDSNRVLHAMENYSTKAPMQPRTFPGLLRIIGTSEHNQLSVKYSLPCPNCGGELTEPRPFNLMFKTYIGPVESEDGIAYLRPETAQAIFAQFKNVLETSRQRVPFGIAQVGKAFRNEVTPRNFTFRSREFEQMELEFFIKPDEVVEAISGRVASAAEVFGVPPSGGSEPAKAGTPNPEPNWGWEAWHKYWVEERVRFYEGIGLSRQTLGFHIQTAEELAHYARACTDILFKFPFSKKDEQGNVVGDELEGIAARSDFDLSQHARFSGKPMGVFDDELRAAWGKLPKEKQDELRKRYFDNRNKYLTKMAKPDETPEQIEKQSTADADGLAKGQYIPHVIEPSAGVDRLILALIANAYSEVTKTDDKGKSETTVVMKFHPRVAPIKVGVMPLLKNKPDLVKKGLEVRDLLRPWMNVFYDDGGSIGRRYARQDEAGTPFCVTIDFDTLGEKPELLNTVTIRHRDDGRQERLAISELLNWLLPKIR